MTWFRRGGRDTAPAPPSPSSDDSPTVLRQKLYELNQYINRHSGRLPGEEVVISRQVTDILREIVDTSEVRELDIYAIVSVKGIMSDYLPTTLKAFLALDSSQVNVPRPSGRTPSESLLEQIDALLAAASEVLAAVQAQDADALITQGNFLRTKFSRSDLDL